MRPRALLLGPSLLSVFLLRTFPQKTNVTQIRTKRRSPAGLWKSLARTAPFRFCY